MAEVVFEDQIVTRNWDIHFWANFDGKPIKVRVKLETLQDSWRKRGLVEADTSESPKDIFAKHRYYFETLAKKKLHELVSLYNNEAIEWIEI